MARVKEKHRRDFWAYVTWSRLWSGPRQHVLLPNKGETDVVRAWVDADSNGRMPDQCSHPRLFRAAIQGKMSLNLQIKEWAAGYFICGARTWIDEAKAEGLHWLPEWTWEAVINQAYALDTSINIR